MRLCEVDGCAGKHYMKGYCSKHYQQIRRNGKILKRTIYDPNKFVLDGDICRIKLYDKYNKERAEAIIDAEDYERVRYKKWYFVKAGYAFTKCGKGNERLHWAITGKPPFGYHIDHINGNKLDNRMRNLRICTNSQNLRNRGKQKNNTSGFKGLSWDNKNNKWFVQLVVKGRRIFLGRFESKHQAVQVYNEAALKYHGEFARLNEVQQ